MKDRNIRRAIRHRPVALSEQRAKRSLHLILGVIAGRFGLAVAQSLVRLTRILEFGGMDEPGKFATEGVSVDADMNLVFLAFDEAFAQPGLVAVSSSLRHTPHEVPVFVAGVDLSSQSIERLNALDPTRIRIADITEEVRDASAQMSQHSRHPPVVWARTLVGQIVPATTKRVLYLDADTLVRKPLQELLAADLHGRMLGACVDHLTTTHGQRGPAFYQIVQSPPYAAYFNSGVLVIDLEQWRERQIEGQLLDLASKWAFKYSDQDALNLIGWRDWYPLPATRWNFSALEHTGASHASVVHYVGAKPWVAPSVNRLFQLEYQLAANEVGWDIRLPWRLRLKGHLRSWLPTGYTNRRRARIERRYSFGLDEF